MYDDFDTQAQSDEFISEYEEYLAFLASLEEEEYYNHMEKEFGDIL